MIQSLQLLHEIIHEPVGICGLIIRDALQYTYQLEEDPYVKGFHLWNVGSGAQWYDIMSCLPDLADALIRYYTFKP